MSCEFCRFWQSRYDRTRYVEHNRLEREDKKRYEDLFSFGVCCRWAPGIKKDNGETNRYYCCGDFQLRDIRPSNHDGGQYGSAVGERIRRLREDIDELRGERTRRIALGKQAKELRKQIRELKRSADGQAKIATD